MGAGVLRFFSPPRAGFFGPRRPPTFSRSLPSTPPCPVFDHAALRSKIMSASEAAALIPAGANVGMSGFTGGGSSQGRAQGAGPTHAGRQCPPERPSASAWTGARRPRSWMARSRRWMAWNCACPTSPTPSAATHQMPARWNTSTSTSRTWPSLSGPALGKLDVAVVEVAGILQDAPDRRRPSAVQGTWLDQADKIILEVNRWQNPALEGTTTLLRHGPAAAPQLIPILRRTTGSAMRITALIQPHHRHRRDRSSRPQHALYRAG